MPKLNPSRRRKGKRRKKGYAKEAKERKWIIRTLISKTGGKCEYCGRTCNKKNMTIDHVLPVSRGGLTEIQNLRLACYPCNQEKGNGISFDVFIEN